MEKRKQLIVSAIENGTVIDHIPVDSLFIVVKILGLEKLNEQVTIGYNFDSKKHGKKGIIKVSNKYFEDLEINKIALAAPTASIIVIKDFQVIEKKYVELPETVGNIVSCINPKCITNNEEVECKYTVVKNGGDDLKIKCHYCEKFTTKKNMVFK
ncbi:aspartate carbamoyltransferase regulatory subunit [Bacteroidales bacterium OttesenSCG-928-K03]|nr:aspartate carbamoyltransferase regulatory subunit [Bacteroidales bacterium OttesenSCG-928-K03]